MKNATVKINNHALLKMTSIETIYSAFCQQRGRDLRGVATRGRDLVKASTRMKAQRITPNHMLAFAEECHKSLQVQIAACKTESDYEKLGEALWSQLGAKESGYLLAANHNPRPPICAEVEKQFANAGLEVRAEFHKGDSCVDSSIELFAAWQGNGDVGYSVQIAEYMAPTKFGANYYSGKGDDWGVMTLKMTKTLYAAIWNIIKHIKENNTLEF